MRRLSLVHFLVLFLILCFFLLVTELSLQKCPSCPPCRFSSPQSSSDEDRSFASYDLVIPFIDLHHISHLSSCSLKYATPRNDGIAFSVDLSDGECCIGYVSAVPHPSQPGVVHLYYRVFTPEMYNESLPLKTRARNQEYRIAVSHDCGKTFKRLENIDGNEGNTVLCCGDVAHSAVFGVKNDKNVSQWISASGQWPTHLLTSEDGLKWKDNHAVLPDAYGDGLHSLFFDEEENVYKVFSRWNEGVQKRNFHFSYSKDFLHWSEYVSPSVEYAGGECGMSEQVYTSQVQPYPGEKGVLLAIIQQWKLNNGGRGVVDDWLNEDNIVSETHVLLSRDGGVTWNRPADGSGSLFLTLEDVGMAKKQLPNGMRRPYMFFVTTPFLLEEENCGDGDGRWFFYGMVDADCGTTMDCRGLGSVVRFSVPSNRLASLQCTDKVEKGVIQTKPILVCGPSLFVQHNILDGDGWIRVEFWESDGSGPLRGYGEGDGVVIRRPHKPPYPLRERVRWRGRDSTDGDLVGKEIVIIMYVFHAEVFALEFESM